MAQEPTHTRMGVTGSQLACSVCHRPCARSVKQLDRDEAIVHEVGLMDLCPHSSHTTCITALPAEGCRKVVQERVLHEMLGSIQDPTGGGWKVLVLDSTTTRILSSAMRMSDILEAGVSESS